MSVSAKILIVEDEPISRRVLAQSLTVSGYQVVEALTGAAALEALPQESPDLVVLDVELPDFSGIEVVRRMRSLGHAEPVIFLTSHDAIECKVEGLDAGGDDYLEKPYHYLELAARVAALLRRSGGGSPCRRLVWGEVEVDLDRKSARRGCEPLALTRTEFALLDCLLSAGGRPVSRERLLQSVFGYSPQASTRTVETHMWRLRKKLGDPGDAKGWIQNRSGAGYVLTSANTPAAVTLAAAG